MLLDPPHPIHNECESVWKKVVLLSQIVRIGPYWLKHGWCLLSTLNMQGVPEVVRHADFYDDFIDNNHNRCSNC